MALTAPLASDRSSTSPPVLTRVAIAAPPASPGRARQNPGAASVGQVDGGHVVGRHQRAASASRARAYLGWRRHALDIERLLPRRRGLSRPAGSRVGELAPKLLAAAGASSTFPELSNSRRGGAPAGIPRRRRCRHRRRTASPSATATKSARRVWCRTPGAIRREPCWPRATPAAGVIEGPMWLTPNRISGAARTVRPNALFENTAAWPPTGSSRTATAEIERARHDVTFVPIWSRSTGESSKHLTSLHPARPTAHRRHPAYGVRRRRVRAPDRRRTAEIKHVAHTNSATSAGRWTSRAGACARRRARHLVKGAGVRRCRT